MNPMIPDKNDEEFIPNLVTHKPDLEKLHPEEIARWLFLDRFVSTKQLLKILRINPKTFDNDHVQQDLKLFISSLIGTPHVAKLVKNYSIDKLQMLFSSSVLLYRNDSISSDYKTNQSCSIANLRNFFPMYFYAQRNTPNWYEREPFYTQKACSTRWALVELDFLNCKILNSKLAKYFYCKRKAFPIHSVNQKNVIEEIYDRIIIGEILGEDLFEENCNILTRTTLKNKSETPFNVYITQKESKIGIHSSPTKLSFNRERPYRLGFFPSVEFSK